MEGGWDGTAFWYGAMGAALHEAARWMSFRESRRLPAYAFKVHYWLLTAILCIVGGALAALLGPAKVVEALALGMGAPGIISRLASAMPSRLDLGVVKSPTRPAGVQDFLRG